MIALETRSLTQVVRLAGRHAGRQPRLRGRPALRHHRPERRRQDDLFQPAGGQPAAGLRRDAARGPRRDAARCHPPGTHRHRALVPAQQRVPGFHRPRESHPRLRDTGGRGADLLAADAAALSGLRRGGRRSPPRSGSPTCSTPRRATSATAASASSRWRWRSPAGRRCCCSTSRRRASARRRPRACTR